MRGFDMPENLAHDPGCIKGARMVIIRSKMIQTNEPLETAELQAFVRTVTARSLTRAAGELKVPRATLGRRLARLEEKLGRRLLRRTTRTLALTDAGQAFFPRARAVLDAVAEAEASVEAADDGALRGDLRVSVPARMPAGFGAFVCAFAASHPGVRLHLHHSNRHVDLVRDGYDLAVRAGRDLEPGLVTRTLLREPRIAVASPAYLEAQGPLRTRRDLRRHRCLVGFDRDGLPQRQWPVAGGGTVQVEGHLFANDPALLLDAARRGLGVTMCARRDVAADLVQGRLVQVLPGVLEVESRAVVVYPEREFVPTHVRAFGDAIVQWAADAVAAAAKAAKAAARAPA